MNCAPQVRAVVERFSINLSCVNAIGKNSQALHIQVGQYVPQFGRLKEIHIASVVRCANCELVPLPAPFRQPGRLPRQTIVVLFRIGPVDHTIALFTRLIL